MRETIPRELAARPPVLQLTVRGRDRAEALAQAMSIALALITAVTATLSFGFWSLFHRDMPVTVGNMRGTALTVLLVGVPALVTSMFFAARGSVRARFVWAGALAYIAYNAVLFLFSIRFNSLFLLYCATLSLAFWALLTFFRALDLSAVEVASEQVPVRPLSLWLFVSVAAFCGLWLATIIPATLNNSMPTVMTDAGLMQNTVWVLDFAFTFPLMILGGIWLWKRNAWGYIVGGMMIIMLTIETASIGIDQWFGHIHDPSAPLTAVPPMIFFTLAGLIFSLLLLLRTSSGQPAQAGP
jgi:hypothetical protein